MKNRISSILFLLLLTIALNAKTGGRINYATIPLPQSIVYNDGKPFEITSSTTITYPVGDIQLKQIAEMLSEHIFISTGLKLAISDKQATRNTIELKTNYTNENKEAYRFSVTDKKIIINGVVPAATFYGTQTLWKAISPDIVQTSVLLPQVEITDYPRFAYRGMMLDVARHFFPVDFIKRYIDILALHNINYFHWHLSDDQGWRIEIKNYPKLTEIGSQRKQTLIGKSEEYDGKPYGGYYTQQEAREIVEYAAKRYVTIIPEIDLPGHMMAALASYPDLGCTGGPYEVSPQWGVFDDVLCVGNEDVYTFLEGVFTELLDIFPSPYIHVGGDECTKHRWKECAKCQAKIKEMGLTGDDRHSAESKLQSYCITRISGFLNSKGRKVIGWDEILEGGAPQGATIMSWHGLNGGIEGARQGHDVIMTPNSHAYFDFYQTLNIANVPLAIGGHLPLEKVYSLEPMPEELTEKQKKHVLGVQANMWTEYILSPAHVEYMLMPRIDALSEVQWTMPEKKDYSSFLGRLLHMVKLYNRLGYNYAKHFFDIKADLTTDNEKGILEVAFSTFDNAPVYYTLDGTYPTESSTRYTGKIVIGSSSTLKAIAIRPEGESLPYTQTFEFNKATLKPVSVSGYLDPTYTFSGIQALVDGLNGGMGYADGNWLGFLGDKIEILIDLKIPTSISKVKTGTFVSVNDWIFGATGFKISVSDDGKTFQPISENTYPEALRNQPSGRIDLQASFEKTTARFVKIEIDKTKMLPSWHAGFGGQAYLFVDEIGIW